MSESEVVPALMSLKPGIGQRKTSVLGNNKMKSPWNKTISENDTSINERKEGNKVRE